jgi:hypothetical protein
MRPGQINFPEQSTVVNPDFGSSVAFDGVMDVILPCSMVTVILGNVFPDSTSTIDAL